MAKTRSTHPETSLPTIGPIMILQRTDNLVVRIRGREGACKGGLWWHGLAGVGGRDSDDLLERLPNMSIGQQEARGIQPAQ